MKRLVSGNQALAWGALAAGVDVVAGYPGTPSTEALTEILSFVSSAAGSGAEGAGETGSGKTGGSGGGPAPWVEWSVNEKVAFDVAAGAAWAGKRALVTMKMSGFNVALDSIMSVAYSGTTGGLVIYVADDPGAEAGMPEQDSRLFSFLAGLPMLEPGTVREAYTLTRDAFAISEKTSLPVIIRLVTSVSHGEEELDADFSYQPLGREAWHERNIQKFTKAGSKLCVDQHKDLLSALERCEDIFAASGYNRFIGPETGDLCVVSSGVLNEYAAELRDAAGDRGCGGPGGGFTSAALTATYPFDRKLAFRIFAGFGTILVLEELDPVMETRLRSLAQLSGWTGRIIGKMDGTLPQTGRYTVDEIEAGLWTARGKNRSGAENPRGMENSPREESSRCADESAQTEKSPAPQYRHPITFCSGCPHRGTYMALNRGIRKAGFKQKDVIVTGDIGCTILGMNPPFNSCWTEVSMGSSIALAQGFLRAGIKTPVVATIGDSTFFHAGIAPLINAVQQNASILVIILDNGWTSMTGFQVNPGTRKESQRSGRRVEMDPLIRAIGPGYFTVVDPFDQEGSVAAIAEALKMEGTRVIVSRQECILTRERREPLGPVYRIDGEKCVFCRMCLRESGCTALGPVWIGGKEAMSIDPDLCRSCGLCATCCKYGAISREVP